MWSKHVSSPWAFDDSNALKLVSERSRKVSKKRKPWLLLYIRFLAGYTKRLSTPDKD
jgi:hypothetical protein